MAQFKILGTGTLRPDTRRFGDLYRLVGREVSFATALMEQMDGYEPVESRLRESASIAILDVAQHSTPNALFAHAREAGFEYCPIEDMFRILDQGLELQGYRSVFQHPSWQRARRNKPHKTISYLSLYDDAENRLRLIRKHNRFDGPYFDPGASGPVALVVRAAP